MRDQDTIDTAEYHGTHQLPLGALAAVDKNALPAAHDKKGARPPLHGRYGSRRTQEDEAQVQRSGAGYRVRSADQAPHGFRSEGGRIAEEYRVDTTVPRVPER